ncbi:MAG TPA: prepilin-type N-terminal cleavage/methylation domain-containing protein [Candidatus Acidoferrales bacterium]|nr:prepilin-type N-terminal cleavage/methylation domain-containing protein [Candidatus Acidoferrales bacterium]
MKREQGFSLIELLVVVAIILIIAAIAIPNLLRAKIAANEASAVSSLRTLNTSAFSYDITYGSFPSKLANLGPSSTPTSAAADLVDNMLATDPATKSGYTIDYESGGGGYTITAVPLSAGTGTRKFFTDQSQVIRQTTDGSAPTVSSSPIN